MIYLRFITDKYNLESALIRIGTRSPFSHVEFVRTDATGAGIDTLGSRLDGGVKIRPYNYSKPTTEEWYSGPGMEESYQAGLGFVGWGYNWKDIVGLPLNINLSEEGKMICSQFACYANRRAWALGQAPAWVNPGRPARLCTPDTLSWSPLLTLERKVL